MKSPLQFIVFLLGGLIYGFFTFQALMWAVWGAPTHPTQYIALFSALGLLLSAFISLDSPERGRLLAIASVLGVGMYYIPATQSLVPSATLRISPIAYLLIGGYYVLLGFALFYPKRFRFSIPLIAVSLLVAVGFSTHTFVQRKLDGEFRRPSIAYFKWVRSEVPVTISDSRDHDWFSESMLASLSAQGISGSLDWQGSQGSKEGRPKMIVISSGPIPENKDLHYPKGDFVIYVFDGTDWSSIPAEPQVYSSFATLETDGMLRQKTSSGGIQGTSAFRWK